MTSRAPAHSVEREAAPGRGGAVGAALPLALDVATRRARWKERGIALSKTEFDILRVLLEAPGRVYERGHLLDHVWGHSVVVGDRTIDAHVKSLRKKIGDVGGDPDIIETVRGVGYRLREA